MSRGIVSIVWGEKVAAPLERLRASVKRHHPELRHEVIELDVDAGDVANLHAKARMLELSPFDETLFLDADTVVMARVDFGFDQARRHGMALSICENPWARRYTNLFDADEVEYNTGVVFFTKRAAPVFERWKALAEKVDSSMLFIGDDGSQKKMPANDQGPFALAIRETGFNPYVLPLNWNFRPKWHRAFFGPIKIWHDYLDPPQAIEDLNRYYESDDPVIRFHTLAFA